MDKLIKAIDRNFTSPNEMDSNLEQANIVDGLFVVARAIEKLTNVIKQNNDKN